MGKTEQLVPKLRFPGFEGEWEEKRLDEVLDLFHGYQFRTFDFTSKGIAVIKIANVIGSELVLQDLSYIDEKRFNEFRRFEIRQGDILMSLTGNIGRVIEVGVVPFTLLQNYRVGKFIPLDENVLSKAFTKHLLVSDAVFGKFGLLANQSAQANFGKQDMNKIFVSLPTLPEQEKIAGFLSSVDRKLQQLREKKELLSQYKKGLMQQLFSGALRFKDENGKDFPDWEEKRLGEVVTSKSQKFDSEKDSNSYQCIELEHLTSNTGQLLGFSKSNDSKSIKNRFKQGDVLFGKLRPYLRKYLLAPFDGVCSTEIWVLTSKYVSNVYLFYLVQSEDFISLANASSGSKMPRADWGVVANGVFMLPTLPEQQKIATFLSALDKKIETVDAEIAGLTEWKKGLLQQLFV